MTVVRWFIRSAQQELGARLGPHGFDLQPVVQELDEVESLYWPREAGWRNDAVRLFYYRAHPDAFHIDLGVYLPIEERKGAAADSPVGTLLHSADLGLLVGRKKPYYFPALFGRVRTSRADSFAEKIGRDVERSLEWFDDYRRPEDYLEKLEAGETHWGHARGNAYRLLSDHLERVTTARTEGGTE